MNSRSEIQPFIDKQILSNLFVGARLKLELDAACSIEHRYLCPNILGHELVYDKKKVGIVNGQINPCNANKDLADIVSVESVFEAFGQLLDDALNEKKEDSIFVMNIFNMKIFYSANKYRFEGDTYSISNPDKEFDKFIEIFNYLNEYKIRNLKCYLHVGLPKTGTKFLQKNVFTKLEKIHYVDWNSYSFTKVVLKFKYQNAKLHQEEIKQYFDEYVQCIEESALLISDESFINAKNSSQNFYSNISVLKYIFPNAKILISLREQVSFIESLYCQSLKNGEWKTPYEFLKYDRYKKAFDSLDYDEYGHIDLDYFSYQKILHSLEEQFSDKNIHVMIYEKLKTRPQQYIQEIYEYFEEICHEINYENTVNRRPGKIGFILYRCLNPLRYIPNKQLGIIPDRIFYRYFSVLIERFEYILPIYNVSLFQRRKNIILRRIFVKAREIANRLSVARSVELIDKIYYKPAMPFNEDLVQQIKSKYKHGNILLNSKYDINIEELWDIK